MHWYDILKYLLELTVLGLIVYEIRRLSKHAKELDAHSTKLDKAIPLISSLTLEHKDLQNLAVEMTSSAGEFRAVGTLDVLSRTELPPNKNQNYSANPASDFDKKYASATSDFISSGRAYARLMNLSVQNKTEVEIWIILANIRFFRRLLETSGERDINLRICHHPNLVSGKNEFHFRVTDKKVVIRIGSPSKSSLSAGISITDTRVIGAFNEYFESLLESKQCIKLDLERLRDLESKLINSDIVKYENILTRD